MEITMFYKDDQKSEQGEVMVADNNIDCCGNEADYELEEGEIVDTDDDEVVQGIDRKPEPEQYEKNRICVYNERSAKRKHERCADLSYDQANARISRYDSRPHTEKSSYYDGIKRNACQLTNDNDRSEKETARYKRCRSKKTAEKCSGLRNERGRESYNGSSRGVKRNLGYLLDDDERLEEDMARKKRCRLNTTDDKYSVIRNGRFDQRETCIDCYDDGYSRRETIYNAYVKPVTFQREFENKKGDFQWDDRYNHNSSDFEQAKKVQKISELCRYYHFNRHCYNQDRCMYMDEDLPCKFHHTGMRCYAGDQCRFSHAEINDNKILLNI